MLNLRYDPKYKEYLSEIEMMIPELTEVEIKMIKKFYRMDITPFEAVNKILDFKSSGYNTDYGFEED